MVGDKRAFVSSQFDGPAVEMVCIGTVVGALPAGETESPVKAGGRVVRAAHVPFT